MSGFPIAQRDAFLIPSGTPANPASMHLFVVATDPAKNTSILLLNASTVHPRVPHDATCYLHPSDHPFFTAQSYIFYAKARIVATQRMQALIAAGEVRHRPPPISQPVFDRIVAGIAASPAMEPIKAAFYAQYG